MFAKGKPVPWWCGVDVTEESGLVRRGTISRKAPGGLFVDFGYPFHNSDFVPFDRCANHRVSDRIGEDVYRIGDTVEAVYQSAPDQPWRWYSAKYLAASGSELGRDRFAFVAINTGETVVEKVLPEDAVRMVSAVKLFGSSILLHYFEDDFEIPQSGDLGKLASGLIAKFTADGFLTLWNRESITMGTKLYRGRLFYSSKYQGPFPDWAIEHVLNLMANKYLTCEALSSVTMVDGAVDPDSMNIDQFDMMDDPTTTQFSLNVIFEIFSFLSSIQQVSCRKVCRLWNSLLTCVASSCRVEIDLTSLNCRQLAATLHKTVTGSTNVLILSGGSIVQKFPTVEHLQTVRKMLKAMNLRIRFIILSKARVTAIDLLDSWYWVDGDSVFYSKWRDVCGTLILHNVAVWLPFAETISVVVEKEVLDVQMDIEVDVLEKWCPEISEPEMEELERKLQSLWGSTSAYNHRHLSMLLHYYQYQHDERFRSHILDIPALASLRKLTVWALTDRK